MRSIQSGEKERIDLSGRSGRGHLVLICTEHGRPRTLLTVNRQTMRTSGSTDMDVASQIFLRCVGADKIWVRTRSVSLGSI